MLRGELEALQVDAQGAVDERPGERDTLRRALGATDDLVALVESLLLLARAEQPFPRSQLELVNLCDVVREQTDLAVRSRHPGRSVVMRAAEGDGGDGEGAGGHFPGDFPDVLDEILVAADERLLGRAYFNLIDNALKYSPDDQGAAVTFAVVGKEKVVGTGRWLG